jgi:hypothetical protein
MSINPGAFKLGIRISSNIKAFEVGSRHLQNITRDIYQNYSQRGFEEVGRNESI